MSLQCLIVCGVRLEAKMKEKNEQQKCGEAADFKRTKKLSLKTLGVIGITVMLITVTTGSLMLYFVNQTSDITVTDGMLTWDDINAEQLSTTEDFSCMPSNTTTFMHWLNLSANAEDLDVRFTITDTGIENATGISMNVYYNDSGSWTEIVNETSGVGVLAMTSGDNIQIKTVYYVSPYCIASSDYEYTLVLEDDNYV